MTKKISLVTKADAIYGCVLGIYSICLRHFHILPIQLIIA